MSNNTFIKGGGGIELTDSNNNEIFSNNFLNLNSNGIYLSNSFNNNIYRNIFVKNNRGIELSTASSNFIIENIFINNTDYAIFSRYSYNTISGNDFLNNNPSGIAQSYSKRYSTPDYPKELINYNYWNDWTGPDVDSNGIVDFPYFLDTETNSLDSMDYYPLTDPNCFSYSIITYPTSNIILNGFINLEWTPANLYNYHARYNVSYSPDNGSTWYNLASNISTTTLSWDTTSVADGEHYLIKITAGWSIGFSYNIISDSEFSIKNIIPSIPASDIIVTSTIVNDTINWIATSSNASSYLLYQNNSIIESGSWISGKVFSYDISNLAPATYNFTLDIIDELGTHVSHSVILTIEPLSEPEITTITSTNTEVITSTPIETMTKTTTGFSLVVMALGLVGFLLIWKKRT